MFDAICALLFGQCVNDDMLFKWEMCESGLWMMGNRQNTQDTSNTMNQSSTIFRNYLQNVLRRWLIKIYIVFFFSFLCVCTQFRFVSFPCDCGQSG